jgi:hypothetical protein
MMRYKEAITINKIKLPASCFVIFIVYEFLAKIRN